MNMLSMKLTTSIKENERIEDELSKFREENKLVADKAQDLEFNF